MITLEEYNRLRRIDSSNVYAAIRKIIDKKTKEEKEESVIMMAYALYEFQKNNDVETDYESFLGKYLNFAYGEEASPAYPSHHLVQEGYFDENYGPFEEAMGLIGKYTLDELASCVLFGDKSLKLNDVAQGMSELALRLLDVNENDSVMNMLCGGGEFITENYRKLKKAIYGCIESDTIGAIALIRFRVMEIEPYIFDSYQFIEGKYSKIYSQYFLPYKYLYQNVEQYFERIAKSDLPDMTSFGWKYCNYLFNFLEDNGKMVVLQKVNVLTNRRDVEARKSFVKSGLIEKVIILPEKLYEREGKCALVVFSRDNSSIQMVDASKEGTVSRINGRQIDILGKKNIDSIMDILTGDTDRAISVNNEAILQADCNLDPARYLLKKPEYVVEKYYSLKDLDLKVVRAAQFSAIDYVCDEETSIRCIMPGNIQDGVVTKPYYFLKDDIGDKYKKFTLCEGDLLITKNGNPFKVAVYEEDEPSQVIANGNLYIVRGQRWNVNSYYLKAYFESEEGMKVLKAYSVGNTVPMITLKSLVNIKIPFVSEEKQLEIEARCHEISDSIIQMHNSIEQMKNEIRGML